VVAAEWRDPTLRRGGGGAGAFRILRLIPLVLDGAVALCLVSALLLFLPARPYRALAPITIAAALVAALQGLAFGVGGTRAILQISVTAALLAGLASAPLLPTGAPEETRRILRWAVIAALLLLPAFAFLSMFPAAGGLAFAAVSTAVGLGAGLWLRREGGRLVY
jgi:hypothetical protein